MMKCLQRKPGRWQSAGPLALACAVAFYGAILALWSMRTTLAGRDFQCHRRFGGDAPMARLRDVSTAMTFTVLRFSCEFARSS